MVLNIKLYGDLREKILDSKNELSVPTTLQLEADKFKTVLDILNKLSITKNEISHIFVNSRYSRIDKKIKNGDRIGIFPKRMAIMFVEIMNE